MSTCNFWVLYDVLNEKSIGIWQDYSYCEEFMYENQDDFEVWTIFPAEELTHVEA